MASLGSAAGQPEIEIYFDGIERRTVFAEVRDLLDDWRHAAREDGGLPRRDRFARHIAGPGGVNLMLLNAENGDFRFDVVGDQVSALFGHDPTGRLLGDMPYPSAHAYMPRYKYCIETGAPTFTVQRKVSFGVPGASERLLLPLRQENGNAGMLVYVRSRADNYDLIRAVFNASQHGILVVSAMRDRLGAVADFEITAVNSSAAALFGGDPGDLVGKGLKSLLPLADLERVWPDLHASLETGVTRVYEALEASGARGGVYRISSARVGDGLAITISDLTQLQKTMQTLETQHASLVKVNAELRSEVARRRRLEAELKQLAETDPLTGIANRRRFIQSMTDCLDGADETAAQSALILFDIDDFKAVNDRYGHPAGDSVLREIARIVSGHFGDDAVFGRLGGEEFGVFLPEAPGEHGCRIAETLRRIIAGTVHGDPGRPIKVTASFGVTTIQPPCEVETLVALADEALYAAKWQGRNRVEYNCAVAHAHGTETG